MWESSIDTSEARGRLGPLEGMRADLEVDVACRLVC